MSTPDRRRALSKRAKALGYHPPPRKYGGLSEGAYEDSIDYMSLLIDPKACALIVVDAQNIFFGATAEIPARGAEEIIAPINRMTECCRALQIPVIWTLWCHRPDGVNVGSVSEYWRGLAPLHPEDPRAQIHPSLVRVESDIEIRKPKYSAFHGSDLKVILRTLGVETLIFAGIATDVCVGQTLVDAYHEDFNCIVLADATATETPYQVQALQLHEEYLARVLTTSEAEVELNVLSEQASSSPAGGKREPASSRTTPRPS